MCGNDAGGEGVVDMMLGGLVGGYDTGGGCVCGRYHTGGGGYDTGGGGCGYDTGGGGWWI